MGANGRNSGRGAAYVFSRFGKVWTPESELSAPDGTSYASFGSSVAVSGQLVVAGAYNTNSGTGAAYVYTPVYPGWLLQAELTATGGSPGDVFGASVAVSGPVVVVGAYNANSGTGAAYVFTRSHKIWSQHAQLASAQGTAGDSFGSSAALSGTTAVIGAPGKNSQTGAAYVFVNI